MLNDEDVKKLYKWMGETSQSVKNIETVNNSNKNDFKEHLKKDYIDTQELKNGIEEIRLKMKHGVVCPHETDIIDAVQICRGMKGERKYIYGAITGAYLFMAAIAKKLWGG